MRAVVLDGEVVAFGDDGRPSFARLQNRLHLADPQGGPPTSRPRTRCTSWPSTCSMPTASWRTPTTSDGPASTKSNTLGELQYDDGMLSRRRRPRRAHAPRPRTGFEGVVAKRRTSTYRPGRRVAEWVKVKGVIAQEVVIGGWTDGEGRDRGASLGSLLLGIPGAQTAWTT